MAASVTPIGRHYFHRPSHHAPGETCFVCEGALAMCLACGGAEAELPTSCPGVPMTEAQRHLVAARTIDYVQGSGWVRVRFRRTR